MDPYSAEGELINIHSAFHQGQFAKVIDFDTSGFSSTNELPARVLKLRSRLALNQFDEVIDEVKGEETVPDLVAIKVLAEYLKKPYDTNGAVEAAKKLALEQKENQSVQICAGIVLADADHTEDALSLLSNHQGSLDAVALIVQIHLQQNRLDLAVQEVQRARKWGQDSLLLNIAESWVGLREGGDKYQQAFYVFEEMAQAPATQAEHSLVGQAISELHLGRYPEAESALQQALSINSSNADALANLVVLNTILGQDTGDLKTQLRDAKPQHSLLVDRGLKKALFDDSLKKYNPRFEM